MDSPLVNEQEFRECVQRRAETLLALVNHLSQCQQQEKCLTRPLLGELLSQARQLEELLDSYDAGKNCRWCHTRALTAAIKQFSDVSYELLHIRHRVPSYGLLPVERDFVAATNEILKFSGDVLVAASREMLEQARVLQLQIPSGEHVEDRFAERLPKGRLARNCGVRRADTVAETVVFLATAFLNLASESEDVRAAARSEPAPETAHLPAPLTEERLRGLEFRFHNLQSQYDTYVSGTEVESKDRALPVLRGHASVLLHLLKTGTLFAHYYERHVNKQPCATRPQAQSLVKSDALLNVLMNYSINFIDQYIGCAVSLCQDMLKRYAEIGRIEVTIPQYRGFHVRPSTLISKLVHHYGSQVKMFLADDVYDAGSCLDLFRANEKINAQKRRWLAREIVRLDLTPEDADLDDVTPIVRQIVLTLAQKGKLMLYEQPLELPPKTCKVEGTLVERVISETGRLLAMGKIDIGTDLMAQFVGDKRVLAHISLLAECGYGEDNFGNNVPLPDELAYLRR